MADAPPTASGLFGVRDFRLFLVARLFSTIAQNCVIVVIGWQVYGIARTHMGIRTAALQLGLIGVAQFVPLIALTLVTGWVADRVDRRTVVKCCFLLQLSCAATLCLLNLEDAISLRPLFAIAILLGVGRAFSMPALSALAPNLVPPALLPRAIATNAIANRAGAILGPALGGYLYASAPYVPYAVSTTLLAVSAGALFALRPIARTRITSGLRPWGQMVEGLNYVRRNRLVLGAISLDLFAVLLGGATALLPVYAQDVLHVGASGLGRLRAAPAVGAMLVALIFAQRPLRQDVGVKMLGSVAVFGGATVLFGMSRWMPLSLIALTLVGAADMFSVYVRQSLIQISTPDAMRGRVGAVSTLFISASNELGEAESGFLAALIGPVAAVVAGGTGAVAIAWLWARLFPELRFAKRFEAAVMEEQPPAA